MDELLQHFLNATILGGTYALLGIGLTLIFGIMRVVNFTHGELYAFGAYCMYALVMLLGVNFFAGACHWRWCSAPRWAPPSKCCCSAACAVPTSTPRCW